jgi:hypothetical protein
MRPPLADSLVTLRLVGCRLSEKTAVELARSPHFGRLRYLDLASNYLHQPGIAALERWPHLPRLGRLRISKPPYCGDKPPVALREALGDRLVVE